MNTPSDVAALFGRPLQRDPDFALQPIQLPPPSNPGPKHKVQFVIEMVGPRTAAASSVKALLQPSWYRALGAPEIFVMSGADTNWRELNEADSSGSYDSIALAWNLIGPKGVLNHNSAQQLLNAAGSFAQQIQRRAMPMPVPEDVDAAVAAIEKLKENFDVGVELSVLPQVALFPEKDIWVACAALGLDLSPNGLFEWKLPGSDQPLLGVGPLTNYQGFSLAQVKEGVVHEGLTVGFSFPLSPDPMNGIEACFHAVEYLGRALQGVPLDENDNPLTDRSKNEMREQLRQAQMAFRSTGIRPGSDEAVSLFE